MSSKISTTILLIEDDEDVRTSLHLYLKLHFEKVLTSDTPLKINELLSKYDVQLVLLDMNLRRGVNDGKEGLYWLHHIRELRPHAAIVLLTAYGSIELAVESLKRGASDFLVKPWENQKLLSTLLRAMELNQSRQKVKQLETVNQELRKSKNDQPLLSSRSHGMQEAIHVAKKIAVTDAHVLLKGENGTGKEVMAHYIHENSLRAAQPLVTLDLGSIHENLFEAELFGYRKGAFTDAREDKPGRFEMAQGGTLFLDEIGNIPLALQAKLLTAIQNKIITPLGSTAEIKVDCRIICATNTDLSKAVAEGKFRQDLFFRINTIELTLPPLRERKEDIPELAAHFLKLFNQKYHRSAVLKPNAIEAMQQYKWPGNIRELRHLIERSLILAESPEIDAAQLQLSNIVTHSDKIKDSDLSLEEIEEKHIRRVVQQCKGNISMAAGILRINRNTLYRKLEKYGL